MLQNKIIIIPTLSLTLSVSMMIPAAILRTPLSFTMRRMPVQYFIPFLLTQYRMAHTMLIRIADGRSDLRMRTLDQVLLAEFM